MNKPHGVSPLSPIASLPLLLAAFIISTGADSLTAQELRYNRDVLPILAENCFACHGFDSAKREAGLRLDSAVTATAKLDSGARAIVPGKASQSGLIDRITTTDANDRMPPVETGNQLTTADIETLKRWINQDAKYEPHWAFIAPQHTLPPALNHVPHPVDHFILARLAEEKIVPSPAADRATLIRRVTLDLTGLPPAPRQVLAFLNDSRRGAYQRVVDRLLSSEHFGEHWARWWLDLAHYADSDGYLQDFLRPVAWRYRGWVVDALNRDLPFDQFTIEQLAGDLLPCATNSQRMATGFLRNTLSNREGGADLEEYRVNQVIDRTATLGTTWLGLTVGCAQCHDHKFDAISQREFYQLYAFFNDADEVNFNAPLPGQREPWELAKREHDQQRAELLAPVATQLAEMQADWEQRLLDTEAHPGVDFAWDRTLELIGLQWGQNLGEGQLEGINIIKTPLAERTQDQRDRLLDYFLKNAPSDYSERFKQLNVNQLRAKLDTLASAVPPVTRAPGMMKSPANRGTHLLIRGDFRRHGAMVQPGTLAALPEMTLGAEADRLALARWLVSSQHPLTARVVVNRLWQELFGRGIVATSENLGVRGDLPSHPQLLDSLAVELMRGDWSLKAILRKIVMSDTYRQSSLSRPELATRDPNNVLLARQSRLRLSGEAVRDSALAVSGLLSRNIGGPSVKPPQPASVSKEGYKNLWEASLGADRYRRGLYTFIQRTSPFAQLVTFDLPDTSRSCTCRQRSNTPLQALQLLNDPVFLEAARALASRVLSTEPTALAAGLLGAKVNSDRPASSDIGSHFETEVDDESRIDHACMLVLSRWPTPDESKRLLVYLHQQKRLFDNDPASARELVSETAGGEDAASQAAWVALCSVLLNLDEFINRE